MTTPGLSIRLPALPENVGRARRLVQEHLRTLSFGDEGIVDVVLAVSEAVSNVVLHAYREAPVPGEFSLELTADAHEIAITVSDDGVGPGPNPASEGLRMGLPLMTSLADAVEFRRNAGHGTTVVLRFHHR